MDFMVEHLSATSNQIPFGNKQIFAECNKRLIATSAQLRALPRRKSKDPRIAATLGVLIYSPIAFSVTVTGEQTMIRHSYFEATFHATNRYFKNIVIFVANEVDAAFVRNMELPFYELIVLPVPLDAKNRTTSLPRTALETIIEGSKVHDPLWEWVKYIYFTGGRQ